jgi:hypothetical protein
VTSVGEGPDDFLGLTERVSEHNRLPATAESVLDNFKELFDDVLSWREAEEGEAVGTFDHQYISGFNVERWDGQARAIIKIAGVDQPFFNSLH